MELLTGFLIGSQVIFMTVAGLYFYYMLKNQRGAKSSIHKQTNAELEKVKRLRDISLTKPLSEKTRPASFAEIIGQEKGIKALRAALCGPNPQHVILYGPPGVGKTAAARLVLDNARNTGKSPFAGDSPFIEMDATTLQFDERSIADPLIGSVHDPIYQGAGSFGQAGIPQPKQGAVTKAHGGILFIDEIGEMHSSQMNKLLKVLEDRKVYFTSSYYSKNDNNIPKYIHDVFTNGLPADFRLIGATTRRPDELPPALRSRCTEIFFRPLSKKEVYSIAENAADKAGYNCGEATLELLSKYSSNGREAVNIIQTAISFASLENRGHIKIEDVEEVIEYGHHTPNPSKQISAGSKVGIATGLAVYGANNGMLLSIEAIAQRADHKSGQVKVTGIINEEEISSGTGKMRRTSTISGSVDNVCTALRRQGFDVRDYDIHLNFPGGMPIDGPSAGSAIFIALYSALTEQSVPSNIAMTGEISIKGNVLPVGGVGAKIEAAIESGIDTVLIPDENYQEHYKKYTADIVCINNVSQLIKGVFE